MTQLSWKTPVLLIVSLCRHQRHNDRENGTRVCPRTGRSPWRRKKNCLWGGIAFIMVLACIEMTQFNDGYTSLRPLADAKSEAKRLLKYITHYHYQCNSTVHLGNRSHWPICNEKDIGLDLDSRARKVSYTIGTSYDYMVERNLAMNHSFEVYLINHVELPHAIQRINHTHAIKAVIVANDPSDFSRNSYGQQTMNSLLKSLGHNTIDLMRLENVADSVHMWELIHYMTADNIFHHVRQLHLAVYIDKIDEDYLYSWYRALYELFYKEGFRLYHTSSRDSLCLQVTMMESCMYYLSFIRNPGTEYFVLHPPADYGTAELEEERLLDYISTPQVECKQRIVGGDTGLHFTTPGQPQWPVCVDGIYQLFKKPCKVHRFRSGNDHTLEQTFLHEGCSVHTYEPTIHKDHSVKAFKLHSHHPEKQHSNHMSETASLDDVLYKLALEGQISLLEIDTPGHEWTILGHLLDSGVMMNVTQVVAVLQIPDDAHGRHPTVLRSKYSELRRLEAHGFSIFHSSSVSHVNLHRLKRNQLGENCCFKLGFIRKADMLR